MDEPVVYFKPGCPFGIRLRIALTLHRVPHRSVRFRDDEEGAARVRDANHGNEVSPTVRIAGRWLTNPGWREVRDASSPGRPGWAGDAGWAMTGSAFALVGYVAVAVTLGTGFEQDLAAAAERERVAVNALATSTQAEITRDHALYALITGLFLLLPPAFLLRAAAKIRAGVGGDLAKLTWGLALATVIVWWVYVGLGLGLFSDPEHLPPLVRDLDQLTVPLVSALSLLALGSLVVGSEAVRRADVARRSARVAAAVSLVLGGLGLLALVITGFQDPVAPIVIVPGALILGIALLRSEPRDGRPRPSYDAPVHPRGRSAAAVVTTGMLLAGCSTAPADQASTTATSEAPADRASTSATSEAPAAPALEGLWQAGPIALKETQAALRRHGLGRWVDEYRANAPFRRDTVLTLTIENGAWDLYGASGGGQPEPIDYDAEYEIDGDTVVFHHSNGSNTYRWSIVDDTLSLEFVRSTLPAYRGIPDEVFQRALYMTEVFTREGD